MKYRKIYAIIYEAGCTSVKDRSNWQKVNKTLMEIRRPLWIILESRKANLRLWVVHEHGKLRISTAQLNLHVDSKEYHDSQRRYEFRNQGEMAAKLKVLLAGGS